MMRRGPCSETMRKLALVASTAFVLMAIGFDANAQLQLKSGQTPEEMVNQLLGGGVTVSNIRYTGAVNAAGEFCNGSGIIGFANGIVLTSGSANSVLGPNNSSGAGTDNGLPGDPSLDALIPGYQTFDACVIEFDFIPQGNQVQFNYVFGSEEYNDFVNSPFNDVFGFFVNGVNYALIPGTATPVAINNVNNGYSSGVSTGPCHNCAYYIDNVDGHLNTQLDGLTVVLPMIAPVTPGVLNHMRIGIADAGDHVLDSAVFIQSGSLKSSIPACVTRTARFWFTHAETNDPACVTLRAALQSGMYAGCDQFDLGSLSLPTTYRNSDNVLDVNDALIEVLGLYYMSAGLSGEPGRHAKQPLGCSCVVPGAQGTDD